MTPVDSPSAASPELDSAARDGWNRLAGAPRAGTDVGNRVIAVLVGLFTFAIYWMTLSPDVSFWDSGEFIATSHSLGIPHPPGTPLYVLLGRVFSIVFAGVLHVASVAQAVNLLSAVPAAIAAIFLYLAVVRVGKKLWNEGDQSTFCLPAVVAGVTAALFASFANTNWINSIESEVYSVSGMWAMVSAWLALVWADSEPKDERLLVLIAYLLSLNIGVHLATYLAALAILPFVFLHERRLAIPVSFVVVLAMAKDLQFFLLVVALLVPATLQLALVPADYERRHRATLLGAHTIATLVALWAATELDPSPLKWGLAFGAPLLSFAVPWIALPPPKKLENPFLDLGFLLTLVTVVGFSCHLYLPIRSALNPAINEAQPDTWQRFWEVILRQQYKPNSVLDRQATWLYQFDHMFWRYFREQWHPEFLWWALGIPGLLVHLKREKKSFVLFGLLFLWTSFALVVKMNFTDHEVRERDYFFSPGFFYYGVWMGIGLGWACWLVVRGLAGASRFALGGAAVAMSLLLALWPVRAGWDSHDRTGNWIAHDYAYNMLSALDPNAIIFTNGDNDTFPLWYLQEVHGFRKDVRVINLSLLNTPWYGEQLRDEDPKVPMRYTTEQLYGLRPFQDPKTRRIYWVKDIVTNDILNARFQGDATNDSNTDRPVYFAVTVDDLMGFDPYLNLEGLVFKFDPDSSKSFDTMKLAETGPRDFPDGEPEIVDNVNLPVTRRNLEELYHYRGLLGADGQLDPTVHRDDNDQKLTTNYAAAWAKMALAYRGLGDMDQAVYCYRRASELAPQYDVIASGLGGFLLEAGKFDEARVFYEKRRQTHPDDIRVYLGLGYVARESDDWEGALRYFLEGLRIDPRNPDVMAGLFQAYSELDRWDEAENVLITWLKHFPDDKSARDMLQNVRNYRAELANRAGPPAAPQGGGDESK
ncbi:MAG: DUF2723 domain-containing protein [Gemmatimonadetes bacterium]|nr:DUF2723 domain-containing protein [Gemmatimonadota bacterium]